MAGDTARVTQRLTGDVELTARFGDKEDGSPQMETRGSLEGRINNIRLDGEDPGNGNSIILPKITMNTTAEDTTRGASYFGDNEYQSNPSVISLNGGNGHQSLGQIGGEAYSGLWGVAFYGDSYGDETTRNTNDNEYAIKAHERNLRPSGVAGVVKGAAGNMACDQGSLALIVTRNNDLLLGEDGPSCYLLRGGTDVLLRSCLLNVNHG